MFYYNGTNNMKEAFVYVLQHIKFLSRHLFFVHYMPQIFFYHAAFLTFHPFYDHLVRGQPRPWRHYGIKTSLTLSQSRITCTHIVLKSTSPACIIFTKYAEFKRVALELWSRWMCIIHIFIPVSRQDKDRATWPHPCPASLDLLSQFQLRESSCKTLVHSMATACSHKLLSKIEA